MRAKKAKMLRRLAQQMTVGLDKRSYTDKALNHHKPTRRTRFLYECTRLAYKNLKKRYKNQHSTGRIV